MHLLLLVLLSTISAVLSANCGSTFDVIFLLDGSGSIDTDTEWVSQKTFSVNLLNALNETFADARFGAIQFYDDTSYVEQALTFDVESTRTILSDMDKRMAGAYTPLSRGIADMKQHFIDNPRLNVPKIAIIVTDGAPTCCGGDGPYCTDCTKKYDSTYSSANSLGYRRNAAYQADLLRSELNARIFAIGVSVNPDTTGKFLSEDIANQPSEYHYFAVSFSQLDTIVQSIADVSCFYVGSLGADCAVVGEDVVIDIYGSSFFAAANVKCRIKYEDGTEDTVDATVEDTTHMTCPVDIPEEKAGLASISIEYDGTVFTGTTKTIVFVKDLSECQATSSIYEGGAVVSMLMFLIAGLAFGAVFFVRKMCFRPPPPGAVILEEEEVVAAAVVPAPTPSMRNKMPAAHYIWGGGMAAPMKVHWGNEAPPSAPIDGTASEGSAVSKPEIEITEMSEPEPEMPVEDADDASCCSRFCPCFSSAFKKMG